MKINIKNTITNMFRVYLNSSIENSTHYDLVFVKGFQYMQAQPVNNIVDWKEFPKELPVGFIGTFPFKEEERNERIQQIEQHLISLQNKLINEFLTIKYQ